MVIKQVLKDLFLKRAFHFNSIKQKLFPHMILSSLKQFPRMKRYHLSLLFVLSLIPLIPSAVTLQTRKGSFETKLVDMVISGKSNINEFNLFLNQKRGNFYPDILTGTTDSDFISFHIPVYLLDCRNKILLNDFNEMIHASKYPEVIIKIDPDEFESMITAPRNDTVSFRVILSGLMRKVETRCSVLSDKQGQRIVTGNLILKLSDFAMKPPKKIFGLIKLYNEVSVNFKISVSNA